jgi:hypothetical protein
MINTYLIPIALTMPSAAFDVTISRFFCVEFTLLQSGKDVGDLNSCLCLFPDGILPCNTLGR